MPTFVYNAVNSRGEESFGSIEAHSASEAVDQLRETGLFPINVSPEKTAKKTRKPSRLRGNITLFRRKSVKPKTLMIFTRQLATLINAGLPLLRGLDVLAKQERDPILKETITKLAASVEDGGTFSEALGQHHRIFDDLYVNMVRAGEAGGLLDTVLARLAEFQEKAQKVKNKVASAIVYPIIVLLLAVGIMVFLLIFLVPRFATIFRDMLGGKPLPTITSFVISASGFMQHQWIAILISFGALFIIYRMIIRTRTGRVMMDQCKLRAPVFGDMTRKTLISRFSRTFGTLVTSGVPILQALEITRETAGNTVIARAISLVHNSVQEGETVVQPLEASRAFPPMVVSMIDVGEETGQLPEMLLKIAEVYDDEVDNSVAAMTSLLEPIMIVFLAVIVGTIVIALFMPLISIISGLQQQGS